MKRLLDVLVIEGNPDTRRILIDSLQADPRIDVDSASTLREGASKAARLRENAVLVDLDISGETNTIAVTAIRHLASGATIVAITGAGEEQQKAALAAGADAVIQKNSPDSVGLRLVTKLREAVISHAHAASYQPVLDSLDSMDVIVADAKAATENELAARLAARV